MSDTHRRTAVRLAAGTTLALLASCAVGPNYRRPELAIPDAFRAPAAAGSSFGDLGWWQVYQDATLQTLIREALDSNLDVRIAAARIDQARATLGATGLQQLPHVAVNGDAQRQRSSAYQLLPGAPAISNVFSLDGALSWELDFWGRYRRASEAARARLLSSELSRDDVIGSLVASVATAWFTLRSYDEQLAITRRTVQTRQRFVDLTQAQHERGTVTGLDVATAQAQLALAQANIPDLERLIAQTEDQLSLLLGHYPQAISRVADADAPGGRETLAAGSPLAQPVPPAQPLPPVPPAGLPSELLQRRPDVRAAEQNLVASNAEVGVARAALFPSITLTATGGGASAALAKLFGGPARTWSIGGGVVLPLLDSQRNLYEVELANAQKREALLNYQKSVQTAFREVSDALVGRQKYAELQQAEQSQVDAQRRANTIALARYRVGYSSYFDVITADRDLFTAELTLSAARLNTYLSLVQLYRSLGGGWQPAAAQSGTAPAKP